MKRWKRKLARLLEAIAGWLMRCEICGEDGYSYCECCQKQLCGECAESNGEDAEFCPDCWNELLGRQLAALHIREVPHAE